MGWCLLVLPTVVRRRPSAPGRAAGPRGLWRYAGVNRSHMDGISAAVTQTFLSEVGLGLSAFPAELG